MALNTTSTKIHQYFITILERHLDFFGHVNNATYFQLLEEARWDMITAQGCGVAEIKSNNIGPVVLEVHIRYKREITLRQGITIETQLISLKGSILKLHQTIVNEAHEICCEADFICGFFDLAQRKLTLPSKRWINAFSLSREVF
jgi:thioesterase-3